MRPGVPPPPVPSRSALHDGGRLIARIKAQLAQFGHAEFTTDASNYHPSHAKHDGPPEAAAT